MPWCALRTHWKCEVTIMSVCHSTNPDLVVSGSRDGSFALWDLRCDPKNPNGHGEACLMSSTIVKEAHNPTRRTRIRPRPKGASLSITSVLYLKDDISIATSGAADKFCWRQLLLVAPGDMDAGRHGSGSAVHRHTKACGRGRLRRLSARPYPANATDPGPATLPPSRLPSTRSRSSTSRASSSRSMPEPTPKKHKVAALMSYGLTSMMLLVTPSTKEAANHSPNKTRERGQIGEQQLGAAILFLLPLLGATDLQREHREGCCLLIAIASRYVHILMYAAWYS